MKMMGSKMIFSLLALLLLFLSFTEAQAVVFDVTKYGAIADGKTDISKALSSAWEEACAAAGSSKILIPKGTYLCGLVTMEGPCKGSTELEVQGILKAPANPSAINGDGWFNFNHIDKFTISGGGTFDGQGEAAWKSNNCDKDTNCKIPMNLRFNFVTNGVVHDVTSLNSKNFHVNVLGCQNLSFQKFTISAPATSINTDGIHIGRSKGINITDTTIATGDDCISIGDGTQQLGITRVKCGPGHGISVGSLGRYDNEEPVSGIYVTDCTISKTDNGLRIKSWPALTGGSATEMHFDNIIMDNVKNPILIDQQYCPYNQCNKKEPSKVKISGVSFTNIRGTSESPIVVQLLCSSGIPCEDVKLANINIAYHGSEGTARSECSNVKPTIAGTLSAPGC